MIDIKIYGTQTSGFEYLKHAILSNASDAGIDVILQEEQSVEKFIEENIDAVPAIRIQDQLIVRKSGQSIKSLSERVIKKMFNLSGFDEEREILVPDDYSKTSANALRYAVDMAKVLKLLVRVVHFANDVIPNGDVKTKTIAFLDHHIVKGKMREKLIDFSIYEKAELVTIGKCQAKDLATNEYGKFLAQIIQGFKAPIFMVPPEHQFSGINRIVYAVDQDSPRDRAIPIFRHFPKSSQLDIVHVCPKDQSCASPWFEELEIPEVAFEVNKKVLIGESIVHTVIQHAQKQKADAIVISRTKKNLDNLFHKSVTRQIVMRSDIPILILTE